MTKEQFNKEHMLILETIPEQYREKIYNFAWDLGHAYGYKEVLLYLQDLADIFK